jgi:hypothetical protein
MHSNESENPQVLALDPHRVPRFLLRQSQSPVCTHGTRMLSVNVNEDSVVLLDLGEVRLRGTRCRYRMTRCVARAIQKCC